MSYGAHKLGLRHTHTQHTRTHTHTGNDNTRRPQLVSGIKQNQMLIVFSVSAGVENNLDKYEIKLVVGIHEN